MRTRSYSFRQSAAVSFLPVMCLIALMPARASASVPDANMERSDISAELKWQLEPLFADDAAFERALAEAAKARQELSAFKGKLAQARELKRCLDLYQATILAVHRLNLYARLRYDTAQADPALQAMQDTALTTYNDFMGESAFVRQEIARLEEAALRKAYALEPGLADYRAFVDEVRRRRAHVLGPEAERVLALAGDNLWAEIDLDELPSDFEKAYDGMLNDLPLPVIQDEQGKSVQLTLSNYGKYRASKERRVRRDAVNSLFSTLGKFQRVFAGTLAGQFGLDVLFARARGYDTALAAYLDKDNVDPLVHKTLIQAVRTNLKPLQDYVALRKKILGLSDIHIYDLYTPMFESSRHEILYEQAREIVPQALAPLGEDYVRVLGEALAPKNGWVDVYPHKNKTSGAFCSTLYGVHPFVKLNYFDELDDLSTLAHELGHAMHSHLAMAQQPYVTSGYPAFLAEIASTVNETLLDDYLVKNAVNDAERLYVLNQRVETIRTTIYRQALFSEFELEIHRAVEKGTPLTAELMRRTYRRLLTEYYGPELVIDENDDLEWAYIPHFYYKYYMYSYATGLSSGIALAKRIETMGVPAREAYLDMLKAGSSKPPVELLRAAGVDPTKPDAVEAAAQLMASTTAQIEALASGKR